MSYLQLRVIHPNAAVVKVRHKTEQLRGHQSMRPSRIRAYASMMGSCTLLRAPARHPPSISTDHSRGSVRMPSLAPTLDTSRARSPRIDTRNVRCGSPGGNARRCPCTVRVFERRVMSRTDEGPQESPACPRSEHRVGLNTHEHLPLARCLETAWCN
jgi:hypothetical protein